MLADYVYNEARMVGTNQSYYEFNTQTNADSPESALSFAKKLVEVDPTSIELKYQLGLAYQKAGRDFAAADVMRSIAPDEKMGFPAAHIWRATYLSANKNLEQLQETIGLARKQVDLAIQAEEAESSKLTGKFQQAALSMKYADLLEDGSPERFEALEEADKIFRELESDEDEENFSLRLSSLRPSSRVRKQLEAIDPENYNSANESLRVKRFIDRLMPIASRFYADRIDLWLQLVNSATETRDFEYALNIVEQAFKATDSVETKRGLLQVKSMVLRRAAIEINKFDQRDAYAQRLEYLCQATKAMPVENANYFLLLQFIGKENPAPTVQFARVNGLTAPGDAVPINTQWLLESSVYTKHSAIINLLLGLQYFHEGKFEDAEKSWEVAQRYDRSSRELLYKFCDLISVRYASKFENVEQMLSTAIKMYPEAVRFYSSRGVHYKFQRKFADAISDFEKVLSNDSNQVVIHKLIKICYEYMGNRAAADAKEKTIQELLAQLPVEAQSKTIQMLQKLDENEAAQANKTNTPFGQ
jgi:hypothetical protein